MAQLTSWFNTTILPLAWLFLSAQSNFAFVVDPLTLRTGHQIASSPTSTQLPMVFDFFKQKSTEGMVQLGNLADATYKGELGKGLKDAAEYTKSSNAAFATGLAKSRVQLMENMETLFTGVSSEDFLEDLQDILLQADLGVAVAEEVVEEVRALRFDSTKILKQDDLRSILRGKLIEILETESSGAIQFSTKPNVPTVIFVMGANGMGVSVFALFAVLFCDQHLLANCFSQLFPSTHRPLRIFDLFEEVSSAVFRNSCVLSQIKVTSDAHNNLSSCRTH